MKKFLKMFAISISCLFLIVMSSCDYSGINRTPETFDEFTQQIFETLMGNDEMTSNYLFRNPEEYGLKRYEPSLPTPGKSTEMGKLIINLYFGMIKSYDYQLLNPDQKVTYHIIVDLLDNINAMTPEMSYLSSDYLGSYLGYQAQLPLLLIEYHMKDKLDVENYFKYLELVPATFRSYVDFEIEKANHGYGMPDFVIEKVIAQCKNFISGITSTTQEHFMISVINQKIDALTFLSTQEKTYYKELNQNKVKGPLLEGYVYIRDQLSKLMGKSTNDMGLAHYLTKDGQSIGKTYYEIAFQKATGYHETIPEAKTYIEGIMEDCLGRLQYFQQLMIKDPTFIDRVNETQLMNTTPEAQLLLYEQLISGHFPTLSVSPNTLIKYIDPSMEDHFSPAAYMVSAIDEYQNEFIYLNQKAISEVVIDDEGNEIIVPRYNYLYTTIAHEGFPGHMYQNIYFKNQKTNVLRKVLKNSGYVEGWATYAEMYAYRFLNGYDQDVIDFLILQDELTYAINSRMDMGIHYDGWTLDQTQTYLNNFYGDLPLDKVRAIYEQVIEVPNNCQMYFYTYFKLRDLYQDISRQEGNAFDPVAFHQLILDCGPISLKYVEEIVRSAYAK